MVTGTHSLSKLIKKMAPVTIYFMLSGCASVQMTDYIKADHSYERKIYGSFEKVTSAVMFVLHQQGWGIIQEAEPAVYERDERYENNGFNNLLIFTNVKRHSSILYSTYAHLNVLVHCLGNTCDVEIRYGAVTPIIKQLTTTHNDHLAEGLLDAVEREVH